jgi:hypothetical protein
MSWRAEAQLNAAAAVLNSPPALQAFAASKGLHPAIARYRLLQVWPVRDPQQATSCPHDSRANSICSSSARGLALSWDHPWSILPRALLLHLRRFDPSLATVQVLSQSPVELESTANPLQTVLVQPQGAQLRAERGAVFGGEEDDGELADGGAAAPQLRALRQGQALDEPDREAVAADAELLQALAEAYNAVLPVAERDLEELPDADDLAGAQLAAAAELAVEELPAAAEAPDA